MNSLNAWAMEDEEVGIDGIDDDVDEQPIEEVNMETELGPCVEMFKAIDKARYVLNHIQKQGGMTQSMALEAMEVNPLFDEGKSVGYYTVYPSATRLKQATEGILSTIKNKLQEIITTIIKAVKRFFNWLLGRKPDSDTSAPGVKAEAEEIKREADVKERKQKEVVKEAEVAAHHTEEVHKVVSQGITIKDDHGHTHRIANQQDVLNATVGTGSENNDRLTELIEHPTLLITQLADGNYEYIHKAKRLAEEGFSRLTKARVSVLGLIEKLHQGQVTTDEAVGGLNDPACVELFSHASDTKSQYDEDRDNLDRESSNKQLDVLLAVEGVTGAVNELIKADILGLNTRFAEVMADMVLALDKVRHIQPADTERFVVARTITGTVQRITHASVEYSRMLKDIESSVKLAASEVISGALKYSSKLLTLIQNSDDLGRDIDRLDLVQNIDAAVSACRDTLKKLKACK